MIREERKNMYDINYEKVMALFLRLSGIAPEKRADYEEIVENACLYIQKRLAKIITVSDLYRIQFAAAAVAMYDNTVIKLVNDRTLCTYDGKSVVNYKDTDSYKYAYIFRKNALAGIEDICQNDSFAFAAVEG